MILNDEHRYKILKVLERSPDVSQRQLARELGISLGKTNYCLKALINKGLIKVNNFRSSKDKFAYAYKLTPMGIEEKARVTIRFLRHKLAEYEALEMEIEQLKLETQQHLEAKK